MKSASADPWKCWLCGEVCQVLGGGLRDQRFGAPGTYEILTCPRCGWEQTHPRPTGPELKDLYERFYNAGAEPGSAYQSMRERFLTSGWYRLWLRWDGDPSYHQRRGAGRLLDLGCNEGRSLSLYAANGFAAEGLEINEKAAALARRRGFPVYTGTLEEFNPPEPYAVVVLANVLEHAPDPVAMLAQVRRLLGPGGRVWISCPNAWSLWRRVFGRAWINWHVPYHLWHFSPRTLEAVLARAGLRLTEVKSFTPALWLAQSCCLRLGQRTGGRNRAMRSAPLLAAMMLAARLLVLPFFSRADRRLRGDCLVASARVEH
ncbi:MAG: class I SAM-dependent methyltransferase [Desulfobaccales bacterium]|jgi:SAM-dependent methyltransferase